MNLNEIKRINAIADKLEEFNAQMNLYSYLVPTNKKNEQEIFLNKFANSEVYNPQFKYLSPKKELIIELEKFKNSLNSRSSYWEGKIFNDLEFSLGILEFCDDRKSQPLTDLTRNEYGGIDIRLLRQAKEHILKKPKVSNEPKSISADEARTLFRNTLLSLGLHSWKVEVTSTINAGLMVNPAKKLISIKEGLEFSQNDFNRALIHEIGTHVFRYLNGASNVASFLKIGLGDYLLAEEGMASYNENLFNLLDEETHQRYALRYLAANLSLTHSFYEVFQEISKFTSYEEAFEIVLRIKRGIEDTSEKGGFLKDKLYFEGFHKVSSLISKDEEIYEVLMSGKISLEMINSVKNLKQEGYVQKPKYMPKILKKFFME